MDNVKERTKVMDILIIIITLLLLINLIGDKFINGFKESQAKSYIVAANSLVEKTKSARAQEISDLEDGSNLKVSICDVSSETSPYNNAKYNCDYSYVIVYKSAGQVVCQIQLLDEKGNLLPLNYNTLLKYTQIVNNANKKNYKSINE